MKLQFRLLAHGVLTCAALLLLDASFPAPAGAGSNTEARLAIHLLGPTTKAACSRSAATPPCSNIITSGNLYPSGYFAYLLVANADAAGGLAGLQCGIQYNGAPNQGVDVFSWTNCATLEFSSGGWPAAGSGNLITWDSSSRCQRNEPGGPGTGVVAVAGYFYVGAFTPDRLEITPRPVDGLAKVADCAAAEFTLEGGGVHHNPSYLGSAVFSAGAISPGYNPCSGGQTPIDCTISGPGTVGGGSAGNVYAANAAPIGATYQWSLAGDGAIVGSTTGSSVSVTALGNGAFTLSVTVGQGGSESTCEKVVTIAGSIDCGFTGSASVFAGSTGHVYSAGAAPAGSTFQWSLTGDGSIVGSTTGASVSVTAGSAGAFTLTVVVTFGVEQNSCGRTVTVVAPTCDIGGVNPAHANQPAVFNASTDLPAPQFAWSVQGNATLGAPAPSGFVNLLVGEPGSFELSVVVTSFAGQSSCARTFSVITAPAPTCSIMGPDSVTEGAIAQTYTVVSPDLVQSVSWAIAGNGTITSSLLATTITVTAGEPGAYELTATVHTASPTPAVCTRSVTVNPITCSIQGPAGVPANTANLAYSAGNPLSGATYAWEISGNGTIVGPTQNASVLVTSGSVGTFALSLTITRNGVAHPCGRTVSVVTGGGGGGSTQANAKLLIHLTSPTTKAACTRAAATPYCAQVKTNGSLFPTFYYANLLVVDGNALAGLGGLQCGIAYNGALNAGVDVLSWTLCATLEFPSTGWPQSGGGNLITWDVSTRCQRTEPGGPGTGVTANAGYFYIAAYSQDLMAVTPRPVDGQAKVADCAAWETLIGGIGFPPGPASHLGSALFTAAGTASGYNPCGFAYPVVPSTWSAIKALYGSGPLVKPRSKH